MKTSRPKRTTTASEPDIQQIEREVEVAASSPLVGVLTTIFGKSPRARGLALVIVVIGGLIMWNFLGVTPPTAQTPSPPQSTITTGSRAPDPKVTAFVGKRTKTSGCKIDGAEPDHACTPGTIFVDATAEQICVSGYSARVRDVSALEKQQVYESYGIGSHAVGSYEVDHLISLELGGSNDIANLWPEAAEPRPGFHEKDKVENYLHAAVCRGEMTLAEAQRMIAEQWSAVYQRIKK